MNIKRLIYIVEVSRWQSFTKAADVLDISQPFLSQQITRLENEINRKLIDRTTRQFRLTEFGTVFVEKAESLLNEINHFQHFIDAYDSVVKGKLSIGVIPAVGYLKIGVMLAAFQQAFPEVNIIINEGPTNVLINALNESNIHIAISTPIDNVIAEKKLRHDVIIDDQVVALLPKNHPLAGQQTISLQALVKERLILPQRDTGAALIMWQAFSEQGIKPLNYCECSQIDLTMDLVRNGFGIAFFSSKVAENCGDGIQLIPLLPQIKKPLMMTSLHRNNNYPPLKAFWRFAQEWVKSHIK